MSFDVAAADYDLFMGRYSIPLASPFVDFAGVRGGHRALDVGCGPGALTSKLVRLLEPGSVAAVDPAAAFVEAARARHPDVDVRMASAEALPYDDGSFDVTLAQLVVHFMQDPVAGLAEMARVTRPGGIVAACVWDFAGDRAPISPFWRAARGLRPGMDGESGLAGARRGHLTELLAAAGIQRIEEGEVATRVEHRTFEEWWEPFTLGVGPAGAYARTLSEDELASIRERCRELLPDPPFALTAVALAARGRV